MNVITISGVDGSGKTTQIILLKEHLEEAGFKPYYFHATLFSIANHKKSARPGEKKAVTHASFLTIQLRKVALLVDLVRFELLTKKLSSRGYTHIVSDRYFYDTLINILYLSRGKITYSFGCNALQKLIPVPRNALYLHVDTHEIQKRARTPEQGSDYLDTKIAIIQKLLKKWHITQVDGSRSKSEISNDLIARISS